MTKTITAKFAGHCVCGATIPKGARIGWDTVRRVSYCPACHEQQARDIAADDLDLLTYHY